MNVERTPDHFYLEKNADNQGKARLLQIVQSLVDVAVYIDIKTIRNPAVLFEIKAHLPVLSNPKTFIPHSSVLVAEPHLYDFPDRNS